jgi:cytochrome P450
MSPSAMVPYLSSPSRLRHSRVLGPGNCVGRALALHEMRAALAMLIRGFDIRLAPGVTPDQWTSGLRDSFILVRGRLEVVLTERVLA